MILGHGRRRKVTSPVHRRERVVRDLEVSTIEVMFGRSMEHNPRPFQGRGHGDPSSGGCAASLVSGLMLQSFGPTSGPTSEGRPGECDVVLGLIRLSSSCRAS